MVLRKLSVIKNLKNKRVLMRVDFNVPVENGKVKDDYKILRTLPTIKYLLQKGAQVILVSHLGRPKGEVIRSLSLRPIAKVLSKLLGREVCLKSLVELQKKPNKNGVTLLENVRFFPGEEKNDIIFTKELAELGDIFVSECFAVSHRSSASITGVAKYLPTYAGLLMSEELEGLSRVMENPSKPTVLILGGAKLETKIPILKYFIKKADKVLIGGGVANTFLWAKGRRIGGSLVDKDSKKIIASMVNSKKILMPIDVVVGAGNGRGAKVIPVDKKFSLSDNNLGIYDIGPATVRLFAEEIKKAQTLIWNGAMGKFETHPYEYGTRSLAHIFAARSKGRAYGVCGGGETTEVVRALGLERDIDLVSTGGGAMLEFLGGKVLPGVKVLNK